MIENSQPESIENREREPTNWWAEENSQTFIDFGNYFVPDREVQMQTICQLFATQKTPFRIYELCCGEGLLAKALLDAYPTCKVRGFDGSPIMLQQAERNLADYSTRFTPQIFDLFADDWRVTAEPVHGIVSSLAIHHLDELQKQALYQNLYKMLSPGGLFLIADLIQPTNQAGTTVAATAWDASVQERALSIDGNLQGFDYFQQEQWNYYWHPDPIDKPSPLFEQLKWLEAAGFVNVDIYWMKAGHAIFGGWKSA